MLFKKEAAGAMVSGPERFLGRAVSFTTLEDDASVLSTGKSGSGHGNLQIIRLNSVDNIADVAVFDYRGIVVLHVVLWQVVPHPLLGARRVWN